MRGNETVNGTRIRCYDNGGKTFDRFTVVYVDEPWGLRFDGIWALAMSEHPFAPNGFGQHCGVNLGPHLGKRISFADLPKDCQLAVKEDAKNV